MPNDFDLTVNPLSGSQLEVIANDSDALTGTEKVLVVQGSYVKETTTQDIADLGGGAGVTILSATVELTDAQIKALPTTPIEIVEEPGANKMLLLLYAVLSSDTTGGAYTNIDGTALMGISLGAGINSTASIYINESVGSGVSGFIGGSLGSTITTVLPQAVSDSSIARPILNLTSDMENLGMYVWALNGGSGNFTDGNAANTLKVTVYYVVVDL